MKQKAIVLAENGEYATVSVLREDACAACAGRHVCGGGKKFETAVKNPLGAVRGDTVEIEAKSGSVLIYAALVFLMPVFLSLVFYFLFSLIDFTLSYVMAAAGFALPFVLAFFLNKKAMGRTLPEITAILDVKTEKSPCPEQKTE